VRALRSTSVVLAVLLVLGATPLRAGDDVADAARRAESAATRAEDAAARSEAAAKRTEDAVGRIERILEAVAAAEARRRPAAPRR
jgi:hypothetical protein